VPAAGLDTGQAALVVRLLVHEVLEAEGAHLTAAEGGAELQGLFRGRGQSLCAAGCRAREGGGMRQEGLWSQMSGMRQDAWGTSAGIGAAALRINPWCIGY